LVQMFEQEEKLMIMCSVIDMETDWFIVFRSSKSKQLK